ncbi:hypothetical protein THAOC_35794, partial [Thalassiosira oceanica]
MSPPSLMSFLSVPLHTSPAPTARPPARPPGWGGERVVARGRTNPARSRERVVLCDPLCAGTDGKVSRASPKDERLRAVRRRQDEGECLGMRDVTDRLGGGAMDGRRGPQTTDGAGPQGDRTTPLPRRVLLSDESIPLQTHIEHIVERVPRWSIAGDACTTGGGGWSTDLRVWCHWDFTPEILRRATLGKRNPLRISVNVLETVVIIINYAAALYVCNGLGIQAEWLSTHANVIADDVSRLRKQAGTYDYSQLLIVSLSRTSVLQEISPLRRLTLDGVGQQRLARSTNAKQAGTNDSRVVWFIGFITYLGLGATYLVKDVERILFAYTVWLLSGNTLKVKNKPGENFTFRTVRLLKEQKSYEAVAARRARLPDKVLERMRELSLEDDPHGFRRIAWLFTNVGRYAGLRIQEYGMDSCDVIKYYVLPDGTKVMRAFAVKDLLFYDEDGVLLSGLPANRESVEAVGLFFEIQKNRQNRQTQKFARERQFSDYCCATSVIENVENACANSWDNTKPLPRKPRSRARLRSRHRPIYRPVSVNMKFLIAVLASVVGVVAGAPVPPRFHESDDRDPKSKNLRQGVNTPAIAPVGLAGGVAIARSFTTSVQNVGYVWGNADKIYIKVENGECHNFSYLRYNQGVCGWVYGDNYPESRHVWAHYTGETKESCMTNCACGIVRETKELAAGSVTSPASGDAVSDYDVYECWGKLPHPDHWSVSPVCDTDERSVCDTAGYDRRLSATLSSTGNGLGHVVHVTASGQVARAEVVAAVALALDGGDGFEALVDNATTRQGQLLVLDKDNMEYDSGEVDHPEE